MCILAYILLVITMWSYYIFCILTYLGYLFMYWSPNVYWKNCSSFVMYWQFLSSIVLRMFMLNHRSLQELEKVKNSRSRYLNASLIICPWKVTNISWVVKESKELGQRSEVGKDGCQKILKVITLNKRTWSHILPPSVGCTLNTAQPWAPIWYQCHTSYWILKDSENIRAGGASGSI